MNKFEGLKETLELFDKIIISAHVNPDGDAVASCTALALALEKMDKSVIVLLEPFGERMSFLGTYKFIPEDDYVIEHLENNLFISLDCGDKERLGANAEVFDKCAKTVNIDHHITNVGFADLDYVFESSSTCEILFDLFMELAIKLDGNIGRALYTGILTDTGCFRHSNATSKTHLIISEIVKEDFSHTSIFEELFSNTDLEAMKILGRALEKMEIFFDGVVAFSEITRQDMDEFGADTSHLGIVIDKLFGIKNVKVAIFISERAENEIKISIRSNGDLDVLGIVSEMGGGGHFKACGCTINDTIDNAKKIILDKMQEKILQAEGIKLEVR